MFTFTQRRDNSQSRDFKRAWGGGWGAGGLEGQGVESRRGWTYICDMMEAVGCEQTVLSRWFE